MQIKISMSTIKNNLKSNVKIMLIIFIVVTIVGLGVSIFEANRNVNKQSFGNETIDKVEYSDGTSTVDGYYNNFGALKEGTLAAKTTFAYFEQVNITGNSRKKLQEVQKEFNDYYDNEYKETFKLFKNEPVSATSEKNELIGYYKSKIVDIENNISIKKALKQTVEEGNYRQVTKESKESQLDDLISKREMEKKTYNQLLDYTEQIDIATINNNAIVAGKLLDSNAERINMIIQYLNVALYKVAKENNYDIVFNQELFREKIDEDDALGTIEEETLIEISKETAVHYSRSVEGIDPVKDRFLALITFFILFAMTVSVLVGAFYCGKIKDKENK